MRGKILKIKIGNNPTSSANTSQLVPVGSAALLLVSLTLILLSGIGVIPVIWRLLRLSTNDSDNARSIFSYAAGSLNDIYRQKRQIAWFALKMSIFYLPYLSIIAIFTIFFPFFVGGQMEVPQIMLIAPIAYYSIIAAVIPARLYIAAFAVAGTSAKLRLWPAVKASTRLILTMVFALPVFWFSVPLVSVLPVFTKSLGVTYGRIPNPKPPVISLTSILVSIALILVFAVVFFVFISILRRGVRQAGAKPADSFSSGVWPALAGFLLMIEEIVFIGILASSQRLALLSAAAERPIYMEPNSLVIIAGLWLLVFSICVLSSWPAMAALRSGDVKSW